MESLRYILASLALGLIAFWASENLFWIMPPADLGLLTVVLTIVAYAICAAVALSAVILTGAGGLSAAFLGGAVVGCMAEGVVVGTMYQGFPLQLVWTPLAWHGLITGAWVFGLGRMSARFGPARMALIWLALGAFGGVWALWWPLERPDLPTVAGLGFYLVGLGGLVVAGHARLDRLPFPKPPRPVLYVAPILAAILWLVQGAIDLNPLRLALPLVLAGLVWLLRRLPGPPSFGPPATQVWHHALFLVAPVTTCLIALTGWNLLGAVETNLPIAVASSLAALAWLGRLIWNAVRAGSPKRSAGWRP